MPDVKDIISEMDKPNEQACTLVTEAFGFAQKAHEGHARYSGEPFFNHLFETARGLAKLGMGPRTIAAGLLHDSIEDTGISEEDIEREFGKEILFLVQGVTKLGTLKYRGLERHAESLRKLFVATSQDIRVLIIKLVDRLHNIQTLEHVPEDKRGRIALETLEVYAPIANRLGMGRLTRELEDGAFRFAYPKAYEETQELLKQKRRETFEHLEKVHKSVKKELAAHGVTDFQTEYRIKGLYSLYTKWQRKNKEAEKIYDVSALRIIVKAVPDCYRVLGIIHGSWRPLPGKIKDYIAVPKPNGYQSLHTTIFTGDGGILEIQIRTQAMHREAQFGIASHLSYKEHRRGGAHEHGGSQWQWFWQLLPAAVRNRNQSPLAFYEQQRDAGEPAPEWVRELAEVQKETSSASDSEYLDALKTDFFKHRIFVFTPRGDVVDLPIDSSPVDFAYAIHSDIGDHMAGAKVNGKLIALNTTLKNGDIVAIQTKPSAKPKRKWIEYAKTNLAKRSIRSALGRQQEKTS